MQYEHNKLFTKTMEEQSAMLKNISHQIGNLNREISGLQVKISNAEISISAMSEAQSSLINRMAAKTETIESNPFAATNAIQVKIDDNVRMLAELHARWEREDEIARKNNIARVCTITTTSNAKVPSASKPPTINGKVVGVNKASTPSVKRAYIYI